MRILLATAHPYPPQIVGGAQANMHETARALTARGHDVAVLAGLTRVGLIGLTSRLQLVLRRRGYAVDRGQGYLVFRAWFAAMAAGQIARRFRPDVVVAHSGLPARMVHSFRRVGIPVVVYFHNVEEDDLEGIESIVADSYLANSQFTAREVKARYGIRAPVIVPVFRPENYRTAGDGDAITFINPHPKKGLGLAVEIARRLPQHRFLFVKAWTLGRDAEAQLAATVADLPNVTVLPPVDDMRAIYARTRLLLLPSRWQEAWGRVATEAHFSGIPVVGADRGGIPEAVGPGGIVIDHDASPDAWAAAVDRLMSDTKAWRAASDAAHAYALRAEIDLDAQMDAFVAACAEARRSAASHRS